MMSLRYTVRRGAALGTILTPHRHADGMFVATPDRFKSSYCRYATAQEAIDAAIANGWGIRMSNGGHAPSLIKPGRCDPA